MTNRWVGQCLVRRTPGGERTAREKGQGYSSDILKGTHTSYQYSVIAAQLEAFFTTDRPSPDVVLLPC